MLTPLAAPGRLLRPPALAVFLLLLSVFVLTSPGHLEGVDINEEFGVARNFVAGQPIGTTDTRTEHPAPRGGYYSHHAPGESILLVPAALIANLAPTPRRASVGKLAVSLLNPLAAAGTATFLLLLLFELGYSRRVTTGTALLLAFATIEWPYAHVPFDVTPDGCVVLGSLYLAILARRMDRLTWWALSGTMLGVAVLIRLSSLAAIVPFGYLVLVSGPSARRVLRTAVWLSPILVAIAITGYYDSARFGNVLDSGNPPDSNFHMAIQVGLTGLLFSPGKSVFLFSPILLVAVAGFPRFLRRHSDVAFAAFGTALLTVLLYAKYSAWSGDWAWGPRYLVPVTGLLLLPVAEILAGFRRVSALKQALLALIVSASIGVQLLGVVVDTQLQMQIASDRGQMRGQYWDPGQSDVVRNARAAVSIVEGRAAYPVGRRDIDRAVGRPSANLWDFWWVYATKTGIALQSVLAVILVLVAVDILCLAKITGRLRLGPTHVA